MFRVAAFLLGTLFLTSLVPAADDAIKGFPELPKEPEATGAMFQSFPGRYGAVKARLLREVGGNEVTERVVGLGLVWLAKQQKEDGSWEFDAGNKTDRIAATGLALLPFLGAGEKHFGKGDHVKTVRAGLNFLLKHCASAGDKAGKLSGNADSQAIAALALCEAYGMSRDKNLLEPAKAAVNYLVKTQAANGSWGEPAKPFEQVTSLVGWPVQALKTAKLVKDIEVPAATIKKAVDFLDLTAAGSRKAMYGYDDSTGAAPGTSLSAVGVLCRYLIDGWGPDAAGMAEGVVGLMKRAPVPVQAKTLPDMYFHFHATQVVRFFDGEEWKQWNEGPKGMDGTRKGGMRDMFVELQYKKDGLHQGSWEPETGWVGKNWGRLGTTALCVLTLEVYYRQLPLYKRVDGGLKSLEDVPKK